MTEVRSGLAARLVISSEVSAALAEGRPVVALELTLISHGLPYPDNLAVARRSEAAVRASGGVPATIALHDGGVLVGLSDVQLGELARADNVRKAARPNLAAALAGGGWAGTTVSATMLGARAAGIGVFATGGIGGVHRGAPFDISSDLEELARTAMVVVCAGPKAILDVPATMEYLETRGVPVVVIGQDEVPGFYARGSGVRAPYVAADEAEAAAVARFHLDLGLGSAILVCVPVPLADALPDDVARAAVDGALIEADAAGVHGPELTPWLLARVATRTEGASVRANTALIVHNSWVAARIAGLLAGPNGGPTIAG